MKGRGGPVGDRPSRLSIFVKRQRRRVKPALFVLGCLVAAGAAVPLVRDFRSEERFAPFRARLIALAPLKIHTIQINGRALTRESDLMTALGTSVGQPILGFSLGAARERIDALPFVDHATVERHLPATIIVTLVERRPFAVWQHEGHFQLIDRAGDPVADQGMHGKDAQAFLQLPLVVGAGANTAAADLIDALGAQPDVASRVIAMTRVGERRWNLLLRDGTTVLLPEGQDVAALARLAQYQQQMRLLERPVQDIDLRLPDRMVIRQRPAPATPPSDGAAQAPATEGNAPANGTVPGDTGALTPADTPHARAAEEHEPGPKATPPAPHPQRPDAPHADVPHTIAPHDGLAHAARPAAPASVSGAQAVRTTASPRPSPPLSAAPSPMTRPGLSSSRATGSSLATGASLPPPTPLAPPVPNPSSP
ncbi:cell division protein FtsQ [Ameyamaea chiangmaiensis NBRC 103196]|nr:cell division protein FtsQ/DivIB [Ameyamaea chiangmaiensis]GBQ71818.1 cell division protein FtsQ [Ameyamaea chiangmaiensis NBRC 103196]